MIAQVLASEYPDRVLSLASIMSSTGNPTLPQAGPDVMGLMMRSSPDPRADEAGFLAHGLTFARRIAGSGFAFDEAAHRTLVLEEARRAYDPAGTARQIAAMAVAGDRRARLATIGKPTLIVHGKDDPLILPACGEDTAASIPGAELMLIGGMATICQRSFIPRSSMRLIGRRDGVSAFKRPKLLLRSQPSSAYRNLLPVLAVRRK